MRNSLTDLTQHEFDVLVIGGGINGASAAQHLAASGYAVLLVDKGDFGSGTSSRSSRLLHCGIRYFVPGRSMWDFVRHPSQGLNAVRMARMAMEMRAQTKRTTGERLRSLNWCYPIYRNGQYKAWQFEAAFRLLGALGPSDVPLGYRRLAGADARTKPMLQWQHHPEDMVGAAIVEEFQYDWPERFVLDAVLDAERLGAAVRNHTPVVGLRSDADGWTATLTDALERGSEVEVRAKAVVNTAGIWIDRVNALASDGAPRKVHGTKGIHVAFRLSPECAEYAVVNYSRDNEPLFCAPFRDLHYAGPTEVNYEGDLDNIAPTESDIELMLEELGLVLPGMGLRRKDVLFAWAGVRPLTYGGSAYPKGNRLRVLHDLGEAGMRNALALTAGPIMTHRSAGQEIVTFLKSRIAPSRGAAELSYQARLFPDNQNSPPLSYDDPTVKLADLRYAALHEYPQSLVDLLFRRVETGWGEGMGYQECRKAAETVADILGWDAERIEREVAAYRAHLRDMHCVKLSPALEAAQ